MNRDPCATVAQIEHIALATNDLQRLRDFYVQLGGLVLPVYTDPGTGLRSCALDFCGVRLELLEGVRGRRGAAGHARSPTLVHLGFALESADAVDELTRMLAATGHQVVEPPHRAGKLGRYESTVLDPDGNRLKLTV